MNGSDERRKILPGLLWYRSSAKYRKLTTQSNGLFDSVVTVELKHLSGEMIITRA